MRMPENNHIEWVCPAQEEMDLEIELAFLESRLNRLSDDEFCELVNKVLENRDAVRLLDRMADEYGYYLEG